MILLTCVVLTGKNLRSRQILLKSFEWRSNTEFCIHWLKRMTSIGQPMEVFLFVLATLSAITEDELCVARSKMLNGLSNVNEAPVLSNMLYYIIPFFGVRVPSSLGFFPFCSGKTNRMQTISLFSFLKFSFTQQSRYRHKSTESKNTQEIWQCSTIH